MKYFIAMLLIVQAEYLLADQVLILDDKQEINLKDFGSHFEDTTLHLSIQQVINQDWSKLTGTPNYPSNTSIHWFKYEISNPEAHEVTRYFFIPYHLINSIDLYLVSEDSIICHKKAGTTRSYDSKDLQSISYPFEIDLPPNKSAIYVRFDNIYRPLRASSYLMTEKKVNEVINSTDATLWFWKGMLAFALIMTAIIYWFVRLSVFLYYLLFNLGFGLGMAARIGDIFHLFDADIYNISSMIDFSGMFLISIFLPLFINELTPLADKNKSYWKWMYRVMLFGSIPYILITIPALQHTKVIYFAHFYFMTVSAIIFISLLVMLFKNIMLNEKNSRTLFVVYFLFFLSAFADVILPNMGMAEDNPFIYNNLVICSLLEIVTFMFLMGRVALGVYDDRALLVIDQRNHQREIIRSIVKGQEEERNRVGRELHDLIGANMAIIKQHVKDTQSELFNIVSKTIESVRTLSHGLVTPMVKDGEFEDEMKELCHLFSNPTLHVDVFFHKWPLIEDAKLTTHVYRICQELLQNAAKHSKASNIYLQFISDESLSLSIIYEDNGIGFNPRKRNTKGLGLKNIDNRIAILNGTIKIDSSDNGKGATVVIDIPIAS